MVILQSAPGCGSDEPKAIDSTFHPIMAYESHLMTARFLWRALKARYRDQCAELAAMRKVLRPGDTAVDIGANKGSYLLWLSRWVGTGRVVAFEPQPALADYLRRSCAAKSLKNVTVESMAVSGATGHQTLYQPGGEASPAASLNRRVAERDTCTAVAVPVVALDEYFAADRRVAVIKVDVEGHEQSVFQGAARLLTEQSPLLVFECENRHLDQGSVHDVFSYLKSLGYSGSFVTGRSLRPVSEFRVDTHQRNTDGRFWKAKGYCNNFIFSKPRAN
jgi:FkbM family methyltransferase